MHVCTQCLPERAPRTAASHQQSQGTRQLAPISPGIPLTEATQPGPGPASDEALPATPRLGRLMWEHELPESRHTRQQLPSEHVTDQEVILDDTDCTLDNNSGPVQAQSSVAHNHWSMDLLPRCPLCQAIMYSWEHTMMAFAKDDDRAHLPGVKESVIPRFKTNLHWSVRSPSQMAVCTP